MTAHSTERGPGAIRRALSVLREPVPVETRRLLEQRWRELPEDLRTDRQLLGRLMVHCAYTMGASYCSLGCSHCYLPANANRVPIPSLNEMKAQIDANRRLIGPGGGLQITGGDVVDAYWKAGRAGELVAIVRHANDAGVVPMLMTHGQVLLEHPDYFARLVLQGGLRKIALHIDTTQAGRPGYPLRALRGESDLHPLREAFVDLILDVRRKTGATFYAAHTATVTERNIDTLHEIPRWLIADRRRLSVFRMASFQTEADVGRTRFSATPATPGDAWRRICHGVGIDMSRDNLTIGHPDCSNMTTLMVSYPERRVVNLIPADDRSRSFWPVVLHAFSGFGARGESVAEAHLRKLAVILRRPGMIARTLGYAAHRVRAEGLGPGLFLRAMTGRVRFLNVVLHNFMSAADLSTPRGVEVERRLAACSFRGAARRNGSWEAVPMCSMNVDQREEIYSSKIGVATRRATNRVTDSATP